MLTRRGSPTATRTGTSVCQCTTVRPTGKINGINVANVTLRKQ